MNAGPFFVLDHVEFEFVVFNGNPATFSHSAAFGQWGDLVVELQQFHDVKPLSLLNLLDIGMNHIAYICHDPDADSAVLEGKGLPLFLHCWVWADRCMLSSRTYDGTFN